MNKEEMMPEVKDHYNRISHKEFEKMVANANALPAQTCRALGPESEEDIAMYANDSSQEIKSTLLKGDSISGKPADTQNKDANL